jgi:hypothetical protein
MNKAQISNEILAYLVEYPQAQDTLEGIVEWWSPMECCLKQKDLIHGFTTELIGPATKKSESW